MPSVFQCFPLYLERFPLYLQCFPLYLYIFLWICNFSSKFAMLYFVFAIFTLYLQCILWIQPIFSQCSPLWQNPPLWHSSTHHHHRRHCRHHHHLHHHLIPLLLLILITVEKSVSVTYPPQLPDLLENSRHRIHKKSSTISDTTNNHPITKTDSIIHWWNNRR